MVALSDISIDLHSQWENDNDNNWATKAAAILERHGVVALISPSTNEGFIKREICDGANKAALTRVKGLHRRIESRGLDPSGIDEPYRFAEIVCRDDGGRRFDVPLPWICDESSGRSSGESIGTPLESSERLAFGFLHDSIGNLVTPVMDALWAHKNKRKDVDTAWYVTAAGLLTNMPGSQSQHWHRDGPDEGYIDCFVPLINLNEEIGPTAIQPNTHTTTSDVASVANSNGYNVLVPMLKKGDILMFDYRTIHRGLGNKSLATTRTLAYAVFGRKKGGSAVELGDIHNFPAALTLEYD